MYAFNFQWLPLCFCLIWILNFNNLLLHATSGQVSPPNFVNPMFERTNSSSLSNVLSSKNRCLFYPRCLLFNCCSDRLHKAVYDYFYSISNHKQPAQHLLVPLCAPDTISFYDRLVKIPLVTLNVVNDVASAITPGMVEEGIAALPPTHPHAYKELEACCYFRVLYLVQGDNKKALPPGYSDMKDMIFLNYRSNEGTPFDLYFPGSSFLLGRMALYLAARQLEISQGWLYDYFIFVDDDVHFDIGNLASFEDFLKQWRPAVAGPSYTYYPDQLFQAVGYIDVLLFAIHREAVEVLSPMVKDFDEQCTWSSSLILNLEASYLYRNHVVATSLLHVSNSAHRPYSKDFVIFPEVLYNFQQYLHLGKSLSHCVPPDADYKGNNFYQGLKFGKLRPKLGGYHLIDLDLKTMAESEKLTCQTLTSYSPDYPNCCTIDNAYIVNVSSQLTKYPYHDKILTEDNFHYYYVYGNTKHSVPSNAVLFMGTEKGIGLGNSGLGQGLNPMQVVHIADKTIFHALDASRLTALDMIGKCLAVANESSMMRDLWNDFPRQARSGQLENKLVRFTAPAWYPRDNSVFVIKNSSIHYMNLNAFISMGFDFSDVVSIPIQWKWQLLHGKSIETR